MARPLPTRCSFDVTAFMQFHKLQLVGANWFSLRADNYTAFELIRAKLVSPADTCRRLYPATRTYGPLVLCDAPTPQLPSVRPIVSGAAWCRTGELELRLMAAMVAMVAVLSSGGGLWRQFVCSLQ